MDGRRQEIEERIAELVAPGQVERVEWRLVVLEPLASGLAREPRIVANSPQPRRVHSRRERPAGQRTSAALGGEVPECDICEDGAVAEDGAHDRLLSPLRLRLNNGPSLDRFLEREMANQH